MKRPIIAIALIAAAAAAWFAFARGGDLGSDFAGPGIVEATEAALGFEAAGHIAFIGPREGDSVTAGQELARLDRQELEARRTHAEWQLAGAQTTLEDLQRSARPAEVAAARAAVAQAQTALRQADAAIRNAAIRAPFSGVVSVRGHEPGENIAPGTPVLTIVDFRERWVRIYVGEDQVTAVKLGQLATLTCDTYPDRTYAGTVSSIANEPEAAPRGVQAEEEREPLLYAVKIRIAGDDGADLKPGMSVDVQLVTNSR